MADSVLVAGETSQIYEVSNDTDDNKLQSMKKHNSKIDSHSPTLRSIINESQQNKVEGEENKEEDK